MGGPLNLSKLMVQAYSLKGQINILTIKAEKESDRTTQVED